MRRAPWLLILALMGCPKKTPPANPGGGGGGGNTGNRPQVEREDQQSVASSFLDSLGDSERTRKVVEPCLQRHQRLADQSVCALEGFARRLDRPAACADGVPFLAVRMISRHFACVRHGTRDTSTVVTGVLDFLDDTARRVQQHCPEERDYLAFSADVPSVLGLVRHLGAPQQQAKQVASQWKVAVRTVEDSGLTQTCDMLGY